MGKRWIEFAADVQLRNPDNQEPLLDKDTKAPVVMTMKLFLDKLMGNPLWNEGWNQALAQDTIMKDFDEAKKAGHEGMWVLDEHYVFLEQAAKTPRYVIVTAMGSTAQPGFGFHPSMSRQFVSFQASIINAQNEVGKAKLDAELAKIRAQG
jgi:hypothetical protein